MTAKSYSIRRQALLVSITLSLVAVGAVGLVTGDDGDDEQEPWIDGPSEGVVGEDIEFTLEGVDNDSMVYWQFTDDIPMTTDTQTTQSWETTGLKHLNATLSDGAGETIDSSIAILVDNDEQDGNDDEQSDEQDDEQSDEQDDNGEEEIYGTVGTTTIHSVEETETGLDVTVSNPDRPERVIISQVSESQEAIGFDRVRIGPDERTTISFDTVADPRSDRPILTTQTGLEQEDAIALTPPSDSSGWTASIWLAAPGGALLTAGSIVVIWRRRDRAESDEPVRADQYDRGGIL